MEIHYAATKYQAAVAALASGPGDLRQRLLSAALDGLVRTHQDGAYVPADLQLRMNAVVEGLSTKGSFEDTLATLGEDDCRELAKEIVGIAEGLTRASERHRGD